MTKCREKLHSNSNRGSLLYFTIIRMRNQFNPESATHQKVAVTVDQSWSELITDNGKISPRSCSYKPEAFGSSGPGRVWSHGFFLGWVPKTLFVFPLILLNLHPLGPGQSLGSYVNESRFLPQTKKNEDGPGPREFLGSGYVSVRPRRMKERWCADWRASFLFSNVCVFPIDTGWRWYCW